MKTSLKFLLVGCISLVFLNAKAQSFEVFGDVEGGVPFSNSLREFHEELANQIPFDNVKTTDDFSYNYGFTVGVRLYQKASVFFSNKVSGAKSSVADFSGFLRLTNELRGYTFGLEYEFFIVEFNKSKLNLGVRGMITPSTLILKSESRILNSSEDDTIEFKSLDFGGAVGLNYEYVLGFVTLRAHLDLSLYAGGDITLRDDDSGGFLTNQGGGKVTTGWSGINAGIGVLIPLSKKKS